MGDVLQCSSVSASEYVREKRGTRIQLFDSEEGGDCMGDVLQCASVSASEYVGEKRRITSYNTPTKQEAPCVMIWHVLSFLLGWHRWSFLPNVSLFREEILKIAKLPQIPYV